MQVNSKLRQRATCQICPNAGVKCNAERSKTLHYWVGTRQPPDFSISAPGAKHHSAAAQHDEEAARHRQQAAELYRCGHHEKVSHHAHLASAHPLHAKQHAEEAAKALIEESSRRYALKPL